MNANHVYVLIHSPLVGPLTWSLVADELQQRGHNVVLPVLKDAVDSKEPFWKQHAESVSQTLAHLPAGDSVTLVAHSGAGPLLPVMRQSIVNPVTAYVFVDAGIPRDGATRLDLMKSEDPEWAKQFEETLKRGERFPTWSSDDLREIVPDENLCAKLVAQLHPRGLDFFSESIPVFHGWPDAPCGYILFSPPYHSHAAHAAEQDWVTHRLSAGHFHMLVDPAAVADRIVETAKAFAHI